MRRTIKQITPAEAAALGKRWKKLHEDAVSLTVETTQYLPKSAPAFRKCNQMCTKVIAACNAVDDEVYYLDLSRHLRSGKEGGTK